MTAVVTRDGSPAAAALTVACGTLSERRPIVVDVLNLSALTGVRAGRPTTSCQLKQGRVSDCLSKSKAHGEKRYSPQIRESLLPLP
jgi:hypothetical protein